MESLCNPYKTITTDEINKILADHDKWRKHKKGGKKAKLQCVDLSGIDLSFRDLRQVYIGCSLLRTTNLSHAVLYGATLKYSNVFISDLSYANLVEANLEGTKFNGSVLSNAILSCANLTSVSFKNVNLDNAVLSGTNIATAYFKDADLNNVSLDFSCFPLSCGGLDVHIDDRQTIQMLYHLVRNALYSKNVSDEIKQTLSNNEILSLANKFHRVGSDCKKIREVKRRNERYE